MCCFNKCSSNTSYLSRFVNLWRESIPGKTVSYEQCLVLDIPAKLSIGVYDTTKFNALPMIYVGLFPLMLSVIYFTLESIPLKIKLANACLLTFIIISFYLQPLDLFWQGMHSPNMFCIATLGLFQ